MKYRRRMGFVLLVAFIYFGGCLPPFQSYNEDDKELIYLREKKFYVGENERVQIDNIIMHPDTWFKFEPIEEKYPHMTNDNAQDAIDKRDKNVKGILDNEIRRVRESDDKSVNAR